MQLPKLPQAGAGNDFTPLGNFVNEGINWSMLAE
jgi:hypothetical protein